MIKEHNWKAFADLCQKENITEYVKNIKTKFDYYQTHEGITVPITLNDTEFNNSYVCSAYTAYVTYAYEEVGKIKNPLSKFFLRILIKLIKIPLIRCQINKVSYFNNWLLSTNLYYKLDHKKLQLFIEGHKKKYFDHFIAFRSLNSRNNKELMSFLEEKGFDLIPSRQVYFFNLKDEKFLEHKNTKRDLALLIDKKYTIISNEELKEADYSRMVKLYNMLYLEKYSQHNPQYTKEYMAYAHKHKLLTFYGLLDSETKLQGIVGYFIRQGVMTTPIVGYNTKLPAKEALYRRLIALVLRDGYKLKIELNLSSGASSFKRLRGGKPEIEYTAIYRKHLSWPRQSLIIILKFLLVKIAVPLMKKYQL